MKKKLLAVCKSLLWCVIILLFPVLSGILSAVLSLDTVKTLFLQGIFMAASLVIPAAFLFSGKWSWREIGFAPFNFHGCQMALYFVPLLAIFVPAAVQGFHIRSAGYVFGNLFLYLFVGISEEVYFRGMIPNCLKAGFSTKGIVQASATIFAIGHIAAAFSGSGAFEIALSVWNALLFGWMAMEMTLLAANILPAILIHFLFDFETKLVVMSGRDLLIAECVRGTLMFVSAVWLAAVLLRRRDHVQNFSH